MKALRYASAAMILSACLMVGCTAYAAEDPSFAYETSFRNVTSDPDGVWSGQELAPIGNGTVTIHEYRLATPKGVWLISQIWDADCSSGTCPTKLIQVTPDGRRTVIVDDMMHQVIPPGDPRLAEAAGSKEQDAYARHPFRLSPDGKILINGDFRFPVPSASQ